MKFLDEPHYYPTNVELDIPKDYIQDFISRLDDNDWINHKSTQSDRMTEIWWVPIKRPDKFQYLPDDHPFYKLPKFHPKWDPSIDTKLAKLNYSLILLKIFANQHMKPHTDGLSNPRRTVWAFPMSGNYSSVKFYDNFDEECIGEYTGQMFLNTANIHEVDNGAEDRYNLQICFEEDIETVWAKHQNFVKKDK